MRMNSRETIIGLSNCMALHMYSKLEDRVKDLNISTRIYARLIGY
jgi:hypothetical protein